MVMENEGLLLRVSLGRLGPLDLTLNSGIILILGKFRAGVKTPEQKYR